VRRVSVCDEMAWLRPLLKVGTNRSVHHVDELLPSGYNSYIRLFHPFVPWTCGIAEPVDQDLRRSWESLASEAGVLFHGELAWKSLASVLPIEPDGGRKYAVHEGQLERSTAHKMMEVLTANMSTQQIHFVFSHSGHLAEPMSFRGESGDFDAVIDASSVPGPTYIWPEDHGWFVSTDYDLTSTYIACDARTSARLLVERELETVEVSLDSRIDNGSDQLNGTGYAEEYRSST
jgi:hypothetical protein